MRTYDQSAVSDKLSACIAKSGLSVKKFAAELGVDASYIYDVLALRELPSLKVLNFLGLRREKVITYTYFEAANGKAKK